MSIEMETRDWEKVGERLERANPATAAKLYRKFTAIAEAQEEIDRGNKRIAECRVVGQREG